MGLFASSVIGIVIAFAGGRPAMISGAAGSVALVAAALVHAHGLQYLLAATLLAVLFQIAFGLLNADLHGVGPDLLRQRGHIRRQVRSERDHPPVVGRKRTLHAAAKCGSIALQSEPPGRLWAVRIAVAVIRLQRE